MKKSGLFSSFKNDAIAGVIVFLIALPLCLGIAQASGAPLFSGIVTGIVAGIIVGFLSGSQLSVAGPAAGLTAIVLAAINDLGSWEIFLCAVMAAGLIQLILGFARAGSIANYFPSSVIQGMLAGIGLTIIIKMIPEALGYDGAGHERMVDAEDGFTLDYVTSAFNHIETAAVIISILGLALLFLWMTKPFKKLKLVPSGLVVVLIAVLINELLRMNGSPLYLESIHLVNLPVAANFSEFIGQFRMPDFAGFANPAVWQTGAVIAVVASIETLLCLEATDKMDPMKRFTPTNRELRAQGIGNMIAGLIGGLPMTSVIVRSSANIQAGAKSKLSTIIHGSLLLVCVALIPTVLNLIPKASLAAILIFTGYKLCNPQSIRHIWREGGVTQFVPYAATALGVVFLDLLQGVGIGLALSIVFLLYKNMRIPFFFRKTSHSKGELVEIKLAQEVSFLNKAGIKMALEKLPEGSKVIIDASDTEYIDFDVLDLIRDFHATRAADKDIEMSLVGFKNVYKIPKTSNSEDMYSHLETAEDEEHSTTTTGDYKKLIKELDNNN
ncbi:MAG TPA: SulP family inorganic anion transporter [Flavipsychrobacter sp.]